MNTNRQVKEVLDQIQTGLTELANDVAYNIRTLQGAAVFGMDVMHMVPDTTSNG